MKIFLDTANIEEIKKINEYGILDGVTTNPSLLAKEGDDPEKIIKKICEIVDGPVSVEVISTTAEEMVKEAKEIAKIDKKIVVKIPMTPDGLKAVKTLSANGIKTNMTLIFSPLQALLAMKAGATFVSPFIGRLDDISHYGMEIVSDICKIIENYRFKTEVIVASIRHPIHVLEAALHGAHIATIPYKVLEQMFKHPLTDIGLDKFLKDWREKVKK
jgi:transaldolase